MSITSPHDRIFKKFLSDIAVARDFLSTHLPENIRQLCDFSTLKMESASFVESNLRSQYSDMLYSLQTTKGKGYILAVLEHQSHPEKMMAFRMLKYCVAAMQQHLEQGNETLPVVMPVLFYQGETSPYPYSCHLLDCFADPELARSVFKQMFPVQPFSLADITTIPDNEILNHRHVAVLELVMKHIRNRDMMEMIKEIAGLIKQFPLAYEQSEGLWRYIAYAGNTSDVTQLLHKIAEEIPEKREEIMTIAEQLRQEGRQEGKKEEAINIAQRLISNGVDLTVVKASTGLSDAEIKKLKFPG